MTTPIRVLIADDHPFFRRSLREYLEQHRGVVVAGLAGNGEDAAAFARDLAPDLVLIKAGLPGRNGAGDLLVADRIKAVRPQSAVILYTAAPDALPGSLARGVDACLGQDVIFEGLGEVLAGMITRAALPPCCRTPLSGRTGRSALTDKHAPPTPTGGT